MEEGYKLELKSVELFNLINELKHLYELHQEGGVPKGQQTFIRNTPQFQQL